MCSLFFERFVLFFCLKIERFVPETTEIWICGLYKSALLEALNINSVSCILESDVELYKEGDSNERTKMEISMSFKSVGFNHLQVIKMGTYPFVVPDKSYTDSLGLDLAYAKPEFYKQFEIM